MTSHHAIDKPKPVTAHLDDLRNAIIRSLLEATVCVIGVFLYSDRLFKFLALPLEAANAKYPGLQQGGLQTLSPTEILMTDIKVSLVAGLVLASPLLLREIWVFVSPGLKPSERRAVFPAFFAGLLFFLLGVAFCYWLIIPITLDYLVGYNEKFHVVPHWTLGGYLDFVTTLLLVFGLTFELPLVLAVLARLGLVTPAFLAHKRKVAVFAIFVVAALVTPTTDPVTMTLLAGPLVLLYELGIWLSYALVPKAH